jgi:hypothetical protein
MANDRAARIAAWGTESDDHLRWLLDIHTAVDGQCSVCGTIRTPCDMATLAATALARSAERQYEETRGDRLRTMYEDVVADFETARAERDAALVREFALLEALTRIALDGGEHAREVLAARNRTGQDGADG